MKIPNQNPLTNKTNNNKKKEIKARTSSRKFMYFRTFASVSKKGHDLYYYNEFSKEEDSLDFQGNFNSIAEAEKHATKEGFLKMPIYWRD